MELAHPGPKEPVAEIDGGVPLEPISVEGEDAQVDLALHHECPTG